MIKAFWGIAAFFTVAFIIWWCFVVPSVTVQDVRKLESIDLTRNHNFGSVYAIVVHCRGHIDGDAIVSLSMNGTVFKDVKVNGIVDVQFGGDWYSNEAQIRYTPINVRSGRLVIYYSFIAI